MKIAVVGAGLVGSAWAIVFARAGHDVAVFDAAAGGAARAATLIEARLRDLEAAGLVASAAEILPRISLAATLAEAVAGASYVQESVFETVEQKRLIFSALDAVLGPETLVGSSSSGIPASAFTEHVACRARCLIAHPVNPPYLIPVVELVPAPWTGPDVVPRVRALMEQVGQEPVALTREIEGFALNRLQGLLLAEAFRLVAEGIISVADLDRTVSAGLGLRWSFMGPFETIDLNAPGGVADYARRFRGMYETIAGARGVELGWDDGLIAEVERQRRAALPDSELAARSAWRDRRLMALMAHKKDESGKA
ncbi:3-hydroxyacyl-CoA dehydrogenase [Acidocella sp. C78]|uniref:3-hydroxyacyl-CoA dehydrogenase n=1 Tax=Acidocella sp. C78 TaxID=1671486 RepID=UPI00191BBB43|nr:3-hydroxyacyl-CoA dehydrogenase [Acidocella sp. C78]